MDLFIKRFRNTNQKKLKKRKNEKRTEKDNKVGLQV
jgi:hypothetical protein